MNLKHIPVSVVSEINGVSCQICKELLEFGADNLKLGCRCLLHYHCLVPYIQQQLEDRNQLVARFYGSSHEGILCPCTFAKTCLSTDKYFMDSTDINFVFTLGQQMSSDVRLTETDVIKLSD